MMLEVQEVPSIKCRYKDPDIILTGVCLFSFISEKPVMYSRTGASEWGQFRLPHQVTIEIHFSLSLSLSHTHTKCVFEFLSLVDV